MIWLALALQIAAAEDVNPEDVIQETRESISETEKKQREAMAHLFSINQRIKDIAKKKAQVSEKLMAREASVRAAAQDVAELEDKADSHKNMLNGRLRQLYQGQTHRSFQWLFSAQSPVELERNHRFLRRMVDNDHRYVVEYLRKLEMVKQRKKELGSMIAQLLHMQKGAQGQEQELTDQMRAKSALVADLRKSKDNKLSQLKDLRDVTTPEEMDYAFFERKGTLRAPVEAKLGREYGTFVDPKFRFRLMQKGNFYSANKGQPVTAVFAGKVVLATQLPGYGHTVILDHGDNYYTVYALSSSLKVREGSKVKEGDTIALSGDDTPLFGPGLYFEIRHFTDAVDPRPWIKDAGIKTADAKQGGP